MNPTGRNDPCPCGSGKKYKKCCLPVERETRRKAARPTPSDTAVRTTLGWLGKHYPDDVDDAIDEFLELALSEDGPEPEAPPGELAQMIEINAYEWLLGEAYFFVGEEEVPVRDLLLGPRGPRYSEDERAWMEALLSRPLGLYEVVEVVPNERIRVKDLLHPGEPEVWVQDRSASASLVRRDVLGARLIPWEDRWFLSGALYPLKPGADLPAFGREVREALDAESAGDPEREREVLAILLPRLWFDEILAPPAGMPDLVDAGTGDPILLVTDHYRVRSWQRLEAALAARDDVDGDREEGWHRFESIDDDSRRTLLTLEPGRGDRLAAIALTRRRADEGRGWLEALAGDAVVHRTRELADPRSSAALG